MVSPVAAAVAVDFLAAKNLDFIFENEYAII